jgi:hypothetical protein
MYYANRPAHAVPVRCGRTPPRPCLLRLPDADAKAREYERFVEDLKIAAAVLKKSHAA